VLLAASSRIHHAERFLLPILLLIALALRIGWVAMQPADAASLEGLPDQVEYMSLAKSFLAGQELRFLDRRFEQVVYAYRMPGYPAFLAACGAQISIARIAQAVLDASNVFAVWLLARMLVPRGSARFVGRIAAAIVAINPFLIFFTGLLLSDTVYTAVLCWGMVLMLAGARGGTFASEPDPDDDVEPAVRIPRRRPLMGTLLWLIGAAILAASGLIRPSAILLGPFLAVAIALAGRPLDRSQPGFRVRWPLPPATTMVLFTAVVLFPWAYRNSRMIHRWVWTTTNAGVTLYDGWNPDATGASDQTVLLALPQIKAMTEAERSDYLADRASSWAREDWKRSAKLALLKAGRTWSPLPLSAEYGDWKHRLVGFLFSVPLDLLALLGIFRGRMRRSAKLLLLTPVIYFTVVHMATVGSLRYRLPLEPIVALLAAAGVGALRIERLSWRRAGTNEMANDEVGIANE
jgi:hypothetical protein